MRACKACPHYPQKTMENFTVIVNRYHEMFANILSGYATGLSHNTLALAVKEATGAHDVEALLTQVIVNGENYFPDNPESISFENFTDITNPIEINFKHKPKNYPPEAKMQVAYIGAHLVDIYTAPHPEGGEYRVKILTSYKSKYEWENLIIFYHDCLIMRIPQKYVHKCGVFSHNVKKIDKNGGKYE